MGADAPRTSDLRIAMVIQRFRPRFSGQGEQLELLCRVLAARGVESTIITSAYRDPTSVETAEGYRVVRLHSGLPSPFGKRSARRARTPVFAARTLGKLLADRRFDLVHVHAMTDALYAGWLACRLLRRPLLFEMTLLGADDPATVLASKNRFAALRSALFRRCDGYVAMSPALATSYREAGFPDEKLRLLPQGVDVNAFKPADDRREARHALGLPESGPLVMFVGSLIHRKGLDVLMRTWESIHSANPEASLVLVGRNSFPEDPGADRFLAAELSRLEGAAADRILQLGLRDDVHRLLQAADVFVFPSRREGFGTVMIEAMACGVPCVVARLPGITDFIFDESDTGIVVEQEDHDAMGRAVNSVLADHRMAETMGRAARRRASAGFDIEKIADDYIEYYKEVVGRAGSSRRV